MKDKRCKRIIHAGNWEERARAIIETEATEENRQEVQKVLTRIKEHSRK